MPLRKRVWAEVKTVVVAEVLPAKGAENQPRTCRYSYFSRFTDVDTFANLASAGIVRRGAAQAEAVCIIQDGAEWLQGCVDGHRRDAARIQDFAHAIEYLSQVAEQSRQAYLPVGTR